MTTYRGFTMALVAVFALSACRKQPETVAQPDNTTPVPPPTCDSACMKARADSMAAAERARLEAERMANEARMRAAVEDARNTLTATIYYDLDQSAIRGDARQSLDAKLPVLRSSTAVQIRIEGHADERGSDQYNDALGQRRAAEAKRYLTNNGIDAGRIAIVSFGESQPVAMGSDESAWARNRRAEFKITAGEVVVPPR